MMNWPNCVPTMVQIQSQLEEQVAQADAQIQEKSTSSDGATGCCNEDNPNLMLGQDLLV